MLDVAGARSRQLVCNVCIGGSCFFPASGAIPPELALPCPGLGPQGLFGGGAGWLEGCQQAISSKVPRAVCRGTFTVWLMVSEWFGIVSQVLWKGRVGRSLLFTQQNFTVLPPAAQPRPWGRCSPLLGCSCSRHLIGWFTILGA